MVSDRKWWQFAETTSFMLPEGALFSAVLGLFEPEPVDELPQLLESISEDIKSFVALTIREALLVRSSPLLLKPFWLTTPVGR
jgi:hypothetical protein